MAWSISKSFRFEASHVLPHHHGKCSRLHGHSWLATVTFTGPGLISFGSSTGMLIDYSEIARHVEPLINSHLDHYHLNDTLKLESPTSEEIAKWLWDGVWFSLPEEFRMRLYEITIAETCTSSCSYRGIP